MKTGGRGLFGGMFLLVIVMLIVPAAYSAPSSTPPLKVDFYKHSCPSAERVVRNIVKREVSADPGLGAGLIRLHFHDCFVRGCDGSVLLKSKPGGPQSERDHLANNGLRGLQVIGKAKRVLERRCPNTVSCADIVAFAARDSSHKLGGVKYAVPGGRRDGRVSDFNEVAGNLPSPRLNAHQLVQNFARKNLSADEMVTLSGAHSIGWSHCSAFSDRLYDFNGTHAQDPSLDPEYASTLKDTCPRPPQDSRHDPMVALDSATPTRLDSKYYEELKAGRGLLTSDQTLAESPLTRKYVNVNARHDAIWKNKYAKAMEKMGHIGVLTGKQGEIRKRCSVVN